MPVYLDVPTFEYYPNSELKIRKILEPLNITSILDVGAGHGGIFDCGFWTGNPEITRREACDIFWIRDLPENWTTKINVDVRKLDQHYQKDEFDFVQCCEVLEHVDDNRLALEQLVRVAKKAVFISSADESHHWGPEQERIEQINEHQKYICQPKIKDLLELGFQTFVEHNERKQIVAWLIK